MQIQNRVVAVVLTAEKRAYAHLFYILLRFRNHIFEFGYKAFVLRFLDKVDKSVSVGKRRFALFIGIYFVFDRRNFSADLFGFFKVLPYGGVLLLFF